MLLDQFTKLEAVHARHAGIEQNKFKASTLPLRTL